MPQEKSALSQLETDFPADNSIVEGDGVFGETTSSEPEKESEELPEDLKNRHIRRLEAKLTREREANIELAARESARSEYEKFHETTKDLTIDESLITLYGDNENGRRAAQLTQQLLDKTATRAKQEALDEFNRAQQAAEREVTVQGKLIDDEIEAIEDTYGVDLSGSTESSQKLRTYFLNLVEKLSPKDAQGNITSYADFDSTWELTQERLQRTNTRNKDLGSRGMTKSNSSPAVTTEKTSSERWLKDQGIL